MILVFVLLAVSAVLTGVSYFVHSERLAVAMSITALLIAVVAGYLIGEVA